jgi:hypothetical protein
MEKVQIRVVYLKQQVAKKFNQLKEVPSFNLS